MSEKKQFLPSDAAARKNAPMARGLLDYFPLACAAVAELSRVGNEQHNPGQPMHWNRPKSTDHADCIVRHLVDRGTLDTDGQRHSAKVAWRALALLQIELEEAAATEEAVEGWNIWSLWHGAWWRPSACGYTTDRAEAGVFDLETTDRYCRARTGPDAPYEIAVKVGEPLLRIEKES